MAGFMGEVGYRENILQRRAITVSPALWGNRWRLFSLYRSAPLLPPIARSAVDKSEEGSFA